MKPQELGTKVITNEQGTVSLASYHLDSKRKELFRIFLFDDASPRVEALRIWDCATEEHALEVAKELCERFKKKKDFYHSLFRYSIKVHRFHGLDLQYRSNPPLFDSMKEYK